MTDFTHTRQMEEFLDRIRYFNRDYLNKFTLSFAGRSHSPFSLVQHVGRHSGKIYATPLLAQPVDHNFIIPLSYGENVDWLQNVLAKGECLIAYHGCVYRVGNPEILGPEGVSAFPDWLQGTLSRSIVEKYVCLNWRGPVKETQAVYRRMIAPYPGERAVGVLAALAALFLSTVLLARRVSRYVKCQD